LRSSVQMRSASPVWLVVLLGVRRDHERDRALLLWREPQLQPEFVLGHVRLIADGYLRQSEERPVAIPQGKPGLVRYCLDLAFSHRVVLDLEEIGKVGCGLQVDAGQDLLIAMVDENELLDPDVTDDPLAYNAQSRSGVEFNRGDDQEELCVR
jgi:hypothetical protein